MTTVVLKRSQSTVVTRQTPTVKKGSNPSTLPFTKPTKDIRILLGFALPADVMAPGTQIISATLTGRNYAALGNTTLEAVRNVQKWSPSTVTWNTKPSYDSGTATSVVKASSAKNEFWSFNVLDQIKEIQAAGVNYGLMIHQTAGSTNTGRWINTGNSVPTLTIEYSTGPALPTRLSPSTGQVVSDPKPTLRIVSEQLGEPIFEIDVQIDAGQDGVSPDFQSGWIDGTTAQIVTADYVGAPTMADGDTTSWRVRVRDVDGTTTDWTAWQSYTYEPLGTLTIVEPDVAPDNVVTDPTPSIIWDFTGQTQTTYRVKFFKADNPTVPLWDSGLITSTDEFTSPDRDVVTVDGAEYIVSVEVWDTFNRVANGSSNGDHVTETREFTFELSAGVDPVDSLTLVDLDPLPFVKLSFDRAEAPDQFQVVRDGVSLGVFDSGDLFVTGDTYEFVDFLADPRREHTWIVRAIQDGETSAANPTVDGIIHPAGLWLSQPDKDRYLPFITNQSQAVGLSEDGGTFNPLNAEFGVRVTSSLRGWSGTIVGEILATPLTPGDSGSELRDMFLAMRDDTGSPMILTLLDMNLKVVSFNMTVSPTPTLGRNEDYVYVASIEFIEVP